MKVGELLVGNWVVMPYGFTILNCVQENPVESCFIWVNRFDAVSAYMRKMDHYGLSDF